MEIEITINGKETKINSSEDFYKEIDEFSDVQYLEVWITRNIESISMLTNGNIAWLMYIKNEDEECYSTRNSNIDENVETQIDFILSNGQKDFYPKHWTIAKEEALEAIEFFITYGGRSSKVKWQNDNE
jgi:hypothetical protein